MKWKEAWNELPYWVKWVVAGALFSLVGISIHLVEIYLDYGTLSTPFNKLSLFKVIYNTIMHALIFLVFGFFMHLSYTYYLIWLRWGLMGLAVGMFLIIYTPLGNSPGSAAPIFIPPILFILGVIAGFLYPLVSKKIK